MTTQEAIEKLKNYDELEGKYNEALARIDEYERERAEVLAKIAITKEDIKKAGIISGALNSAIDMLKPPAPNDDEIKVGDVVKRNGKEGLVIYTYENIVFRKMITVIPSVWGNYPETEIWKVDETVRKTGKRYPQIAEILAAVRGENDESSENPE